MKRVLLYGFDSQTYTKYTNILKTMNISYLCVKNTNYSLKRSFEREDRMFELINDDQVILVYDFDKEAISELLSCLDYHGILINTYKDDLGKHLKDLIKNAKIQKEALYKKSLIKKMLDKTELIYIDEDDEKIERYQHIICLANEICHNDDNDLQKINHIMTDLYGILKENKL